MASSSKNFELSELELTNPRYCYFYANEIYNFGRGRYVDAEKGAIEHYLSRFDELERKHIATRMIERKKAMLLSDDEFAWIKKIDPLVFMFGLS